jgi:hypothetical protein
VSTRRHRYNASRYAEIDAAKRGHSGSQRRFGCAVNLPLASIYDTMRHNRPAVDYHDAADRQ